MSYNEMEFMDIDGPEFLSSVNDQIANIRATSYTRNDAIRSDIFDSLLGPAGLEAYNEICVLDTNFLISKLGYLDTVLNLAEENRGSLLVVLPWVVIRELDGLKSASRSDISSETEIGMRARKAMRFVEERLREKSISLRGQKMNETLDPDMSKNHSVKGDDRVLDCCMYFQQITGKRVSLLSNDRNLCIKVMIHDVDSISSESTPKMESLLNRIILVPDGKIGKRREKDKQRNPTRNTTDTVTATAVINDYVMEVDNFYPQQNQIEEDYDMMIDDEICPAPAPQGTMESKWAKAPTMTTKRNNRHGYDEPPAYLDDDPTLVAPKKPIQPNLAISDSNRVPLSKDSSWRDSWTSIYTP